ncbi:predicted protein [Chaetomium globosum CBS 148.51]|uniref:Uncharacterized protein n=1 Tax=Chaetomium globosum (strain ATCC 6205 / CBS 148.51 / DSM 1962 / NBRC 6347 / NRRL 1970) TaxID=306901 RepID=Q2GP67_CHAGB|nr:uncharacterized protein CHGG_10237 [Chaetomium globosum CBS 148.51]EAQ83833.1 predicted protein [Chaetomium globosum CBS 148.51]
MPRPAKTAAAADAAGDGQPCASAGTINGVIPTANDIKFIFAFIGNLKSKPEVNWDELAATMGMGGKKSATERWRLMRQKFNITLAEEAEAPGSARKGGKKATTAKAATKTDNADDDDEYNDKETEPKSAPATPAKRGRKPAAASAAATPPSATPASAAGKKRAAASTAGEGSSPAASDEDMASPTKKAKSSTAMEVDSPLSPVPSMIADEDSGADMAVV